MKLSSAALALTLSSALVLSACSGTDDDGNGTEEGTSATADVGANGAEEAGDGADPTGEAAGETGAAGDDAEQTADADGDAATATGDGAEQTADGAGEEEGADDGAISRPADGAGVISTDEAQEVADQLLGDAAQSQNADPEEAAELNERAFVGSELRAAEAATALREVDITPVIDYHPTDANVLAISREDGESPAFIVVQTVPESEVPELHLLVSQDEGESWKIGWSAPMLPGTQVGTFDSRSEGSPVIREGRGQLSNYPSYVVDMLFQILDFPFDEERPDFRTNDYGPQVREAIQEQADSVSEQATLTQEHSLRTNSLRTIELADGSALTFPVLERTTTFDVRDGMLLQPPTAFAFFAGDDSLTERAEMTTLVFLAVHIRADGGDPAVIAAREQVVGASGD